MNEISLIQLIEDKTVRIENEIENIKSGASVNILIRKCLLKHDKYLEICNAIIQLSSEILNETNPKRIKYLKDKKNSNEHAKRVYELNSLQLIQDVIDMKNLSPEYKTLAQLVDNGKYEKANKLLLAEDLIKEQTELISLLEYLNEQKKK